VRITRVLVATAAAVLGSAVIATAQTTQYDIGGTVTVHGGSKKKPKPGGLTFSFDVSDPSGNQTPPVKTYSIMYEGGRLNTNLIPACSTAKMNALATPDDSICPSGSKIGTGTIKALIGSAGQPTSTASTCDGTLALYNSGKGHASLFVRSELAACPVALRQAIDMKYITKGEFAGLEFTVPEELRHQVMLDITVVHADAKLSTIVKKKGKKKVGYIESTGCKDANRDLIVTFTDETGTAFPATKTLGRC
jgi:hypothetical protein